MSIVEEVNIVSFIHLLGNYWSDPLGVAISDTIVKIILLNGAIGPHIILSQKGTISDWSWCVLAAICNTYRKVSICI